MSPWMLARLSADVSAIICRFAGKCEIPGVSYDLYCMLLC